MLQQRERRKFKGRVAKEAEQCAIQQRRLPDRSCRAADKNQNSHHVKQIEQDRGRWPYLAQDVADLGGEKALGDTPEKQKIDRDDDDQGRQIENDGPVQRQPPALLRISIRSTDRGQ